MMEYCGGGSISDLVQANGNEPLEEEVTAYICKETLAGLAYLHSIGKARRRRCECCCLTVTENNQLANTG